jgi:hypothetical protein
MSATLVRAHVRTGIINATALLWTPGMGAWQPVHSVAAFAACLPDGRGAARSEQPHRSLYRLPLEGASPHSPPTATLRTPTRNPPPPLPHYTASTPVRTDVA